MKPTQKIIKSLIAVALFAASYFILIQLIKDSGSEMKGWGYILFAEIITIVFGGVLLIMSIRKKDTLNQSVLYHYFGVTNIGSAILLMIYFDPELLFFEIPLIIFNLLIGIWMMVDVYGKRKPSQH